MRIKNIVITAKMPKKYDFAIHFTVLVLLLFGTLMIVSTTVGNTSSVLSIIIAFVKQAVFLGCFLYTNGFAGEIILPCKKPKNGLYQFCWLNGSDDSYAVFS